MTKSEVKLASPIIRHFHFSTNHGRIISNVRIIMLVSERIYEAVDALF